MGAPVMIEGRRSELQNAIQGLVAHDLEVVRTSNGYFISNGWATINASIDEDEDSIVFLAFATWNPVRWPNAYRLVTRVERILNDAPGRIRDLSGVYESKPDLFEDP